MEPNVYWKPHKKVLTRFNLLFSYQHPSLLFGGLDFNFLGHLRVLLTWTTLHRSIFVRPWFLSSSKFRYSEKAESLETSNHETLSSDVGLKREQKYPNMVWKNWPAINSGEMFADISRLDFLTEDQMLNKAGFANCVKLKKHS